MLKIAKTLVLVISFLFLLSMTCTASDSIDKINTLIENSISMDGKKVTIQGEIIGEVLERGEYAWINIYDGSNCLGIWIKQDFLSNLNYYGNYKNKGDVIQITGIFHRACKEHGGDVDLHSSDFTIISSGHSMKHSISPQKLGVALILSLLAVSLILYYRKILKKSN